MTESILREGPADMLRRTGAPDPLLRRNLLSLLKPNFRR